MATGPQRDGLPFTSKDVPEGPLENDRNPSTMTFTVDGKVKYELTERLLADNPVFDKRNPADGPSLHQMLVGNEARGKAKAAAKAASTKPTKPAKASGITGSQW
ncbi:hypothetical protein Daus18300_004185 [Diaporthe australafricana]|uniref:Uncharacterized protein n=1 Tax=Diaporthe australafricana TaxID=127596 RepID=A0ABR3XBP7_9PEZI